MGEAAADVGDALVAQRVVPGGGKARVHVLTRLILGPGFTRDCSSSDREIANRISRATSATADTLAFLNPIKAGFLLRG